MSVNSSECEGLKDKYINVISEIMKIDYEIKEFYKSAQSLYIITKNYNKRIFSLNESAQRKKNLSSKYMEKYTQCISQIPLGKSSPSYCNKLLNKATMLMKEVDAIENISRKLEQERLYLNLLYMGNINDIKILGEELSKKKLEITTIKDLYITNKCTQC